MAKISAYPNGNPPVDTDELIAARAGGNVRFSWANIKAAIKAAIYEEGTWTPVDQSGAGLVFTGVTATYTKCGRLVTMFLSLTFPVTASASVVKIGGFPYAAGAHGPGSVSGFIPVTTSIITARGLYAGGGSDNFSIDKNNGTVTAINSDFSGCALYAVIFLQT